MASAGYDYIKKHRISPNKEKIHLEKLNRFPLSKGMVISKTQVFLGHWYQGWLSERPSQ